MIDHQMRSSHEDTDSICLYRMLHATDTFD
jgi:hypothetical protein